MNNPDFKKESKIAINKLYEMIIKNDDIKSEIQSFCLQKNESEEMNINEEFTSRSKIEKKIMTTFNNKYNSHCKKKYKYIEQIMYNLMFNKNTHLVTVFKDYMIWDYVDEFLKRFYYKYETTERLPKFASFYKNYLDFFCQPAFCDFFYNDLIQKNREKKAELFYNENFHAKKGKDTQEDEGLFEDSEESEEEDEYSNISNSKKNKTIFNETIKKKIEKYSPINTSMVLPDSETRLKTDQSGLLISISNESSLSNLVKYMKHSNKNNAKKNNNHVLPELKNNVNNENKEKSNIIKEGKLSPIRTNNIINNKNLKFFKKMMPKQPSFSGSNKNNTETETNKKIEKFSPKIANNNNNNKNYIFREISDYSAKHNYTAINQQTETKFIKKLDNISNNVKKIYRNDNFSTNSKKSMTMAKIEKININNNNNYNNLSNKILLVL